MAHLSKAVHDYRLSAMHRLMDRLRVDALLGVVEVEACRLEREAFAPPGVGGEQFAQVAAAHRRRVALQGLPFRPRGQTRRLHRAIRHRVSLAECVHEPERRRFNVHPMRFA